MKGEKAEKNIQTLSLHFAHTGRIQRPHLLLKTKTKLPKQQQKTQPPVPLFLINNQNSHSSKNFELCSHLYSVGTEVILASRTTTLPSSSLNSQGVCLPLLPKVRTISKSSSAELKLGQGSPSWWVLGGLVCVCWQNGWYQPQNLQSYNILLLILEWEGIWVGGGGLWC